MAAPPVALVSTPGERSLLLGHRSRRSRDCDPLGSTEAASAGQVPTAPSSTKRPSSPPSSWAPISTCRAWEGSWRSTPWRAGRRMTMTTSGDPTNSLDLDGRFKYEFNFALGYSDFSAAGFMRGVSNSFGRVFPINGTARRLFGPGQRMSLRVGILPFNVVVSSKSSTGWRFNAAPGHPDYPGGWVDFRFARNGAGPSRSASRVAGPGYTPAGFPRLFGKVEYRRFAGAIWGSFARTLRRFNRNYRLV